MGLFFNWMANSSASLKVLGVAKIVTGKIAKLDRSTWQVSALLIDVESAETIRAESVLHQGRLIGLLRMSKHLMQSCVFPVKEIERQSIGAFFVPESNAPLSSVLIAPHAKYDKS